MKLLILLIGFSLVLSACGDDSTDSENELTESSGSVMQSEILDTCFCLDLDVDTNGTYFMKEKLYTGICIDYYPATESKYIEKSILDGKLHGKITYFSKSGEILTQEIYENGKKKRSGEVDVLSCDCSELEKIDGNAGTNGISRYLLDGIPFTGNCTETYPESAQIYMDIKYKNGVIHGRSVYFNRDGSTMYIEEHTLGNLINTIY